MSSVRLTLAERMLLAADGRRGARILRSILSDGSQRSIVRARTTHGLWLSLDLDEWIDRRILKEGYYEQEVLNAILEHLPPAGVFWDVGANIGLHSLTVKYLCPKASVVAFEPSPRTAGRLLEHRISTGVEIQIVSLALGKTPGIADLSVVSRGNSGLSSLSPWSKTSYPASVKVAVDTGDRVAEALRQSPSVIKIDVEGFEKEVIEGLQVTLSARTVSAVIFETTPERLETISQMLFSHGYTCAAVDSSGNYKATRSPT